MSIKIDMPDIKVLIRNDPNDTTVKLDIPDLKVSVRNDQTYNAIIANPRSSVIRSGSYLSVADVATSASYAISSSYSANTISSSFALTASYVSGAASTWDSISNKPSGLVSSSTQVDYTQIQNQPTTIPTASYVLNAVSSSFATTASTATSITFTPATASYSVTSSYALNAGAGSGFPFSGSAVITGSLLISGSGGRISGSLNVTNGITGSLFGTSSWANNAVSSSFTTTSSFAISSSRTVTASNAITASYALNADLLDGINSTTFATTGSNVFSGTQTISGSLLTNADTLIFTGSIFTSGSLSVIGGTITGSLLGSSSYAVTASYIDGGFY